jgi:hypothetical protein
VAVKSSVGIRQVCNSCALASSALLVIQVIQRQLVQNMMSYRLSYPLYLDVSDHNKHNPLQINRITGYHSESSTSPATALINLNTFYENMMTSGHNSTITTRSHLPSLGISSNEYYNSSIGGNKKLLPESDSSKSSFSIEAILGINNRQNNNYLSAQDCNQYHLNGIKYRPEYSINEMYAKASNLSKAKSIASVSPDSTAKGMHSFIQLNCLLDIILQLNAIN